MSRSGPGRSARSSTLAENNAAPQPPRTAGRGRYDSAPDAQPAAQRVRSPRMTSGTGPAACGSTRSRRSRTRRSGSCSRSGALALAVVVSAWTWPRARTVVTIVHEGGHAIVALFTGQRKVRVRLYRDAAGETHLDRHRKRPRRRADRSGGLSGTVAGRPRRGRAAHHRSPDWNAAARARAADRARDRREESGTACSPSSSRAARLPRSACMPRR